MFWSGGGPWWQKTLNFFRTAPLWGPPLLRRVLTWRSLLTLAGVVVCFYALSVLWYVQTVPDLGIRSAFSPVVKAVYPDYVKADGQGSVLQAGDTITRVGDQPIHTWSDLLAVPLALHKQLTNELTPAERPWLKTVGQEEKQTWIKVQFQRSGTPGTLECWCLLGTLPVEELVPTILWFFLKVMLFVVGVLVFWKRPADEAAAQFFFLCIVTLGAYMGGYHWSHIATMPALLLIFMVCGVLLPVASLHFYLVFPRPKVFLKRHPLASLLAVYGVPLLMLVLLMGTYFRARGLFQGHSSAADIIGALEDLRRTIYCSLAISGLWFLASVMALVHSYLSVADGLQRNQVRWMLYGASAALLPIGYSLYLAVWEPNAFGAGAATWPMFAASVCFTIAFAVSIMRYRLMELDQIISSGFRYFLISFGVGVVYYAVVFLGTLVFTPMVLRGPPLKEVLTVCTTALVLMLVFDLARSRLQTALDRRFYRAKYQLDRTLQRLGQAIQQLVDPQALAQRLLQASADLLGVPRGSVYLCEGEPPLYRLAGTLGAPPPLNELSSGCPLIEALEKGAVVLGRPRPGFSLTPAQRQLHFLGGELAHPLAHEGRLLALLVLGPKETGAYGEEDLSLLAAFAQITVLALESTEGHRTIELLNHDLQAKVEKISEQQRRILALQSQLQSGVRSQGSGDRRQESGVSPSLTPDPCLLTPDSCLLSPGIIGSSPVVRQLLHEVRKVSASQSAVLIRGENGTGKELLARALHDNSARGGKAFVPVHCAALAPGLLESELFGHIKGAFTGAVDNKIGRFELANGGTLFLDEIGDINVDVQTKLLRVLQEKCFERVGSSTSVQVDVRIVAATDQNLEQLIRQGRFREALYYRLNVISLHVPPLRQRCEDIPELVQHFLRLYGERCGKEVLQLDDDALWMLKAYHWPGNVRQLENVIHRAVVLADGPLVTVHELAPEVVQAFKNSEEELETKPAPRNGAPHAERYQGVPGERAQRDRQERERLVRALAAAGGNKAEAARALGLARSTLISRLKKHGLS
jgi:transcriptional regulator with GAF, ATPase, and Fis domain